MRLLLCMLLSYLSITLCKQKYAIYSLQSENNSYHISLTFDDGPHQILTPRLLDILKDKNVKVTFFFMGIKIPMHPNIVLRAFNEGHEIANHAFNHPVLAHIDYHSVHEQLNITSNNIYNAIHQYPKYMRPPYGNTNNKLNEHIYVNEKLIPVLWSYDTLDWKRPKPEDIIKRTLKHIKPGDVILCHDIHPTTIEAIPGLIDALRNNGYTFLKLSDMVNESPEYAKQFNIKRNLRG